MIIIYTIATADDLSRIQVFVDFWLSGRGMKTGAKGAVNDCFVSKGQHLGYIQKSTVLLADVNHQLVGWAVMHRNGTLIHLLVAGDYRGKGIGTRMLQILSPPKVRSKTDQSTGDPTSYYLSRGFCVSHRESSRPTYRQPDIRRCPADNIVVLLKAKTHRD